MSLLQEEKIKSELEKKFSLDILGFEIQRERRIWLEVKKEKAVEIMAYMKNKLDFNHISAISGMDMGDNLGAIYHLVQTGIVANIVVETPLSNPRLDTITEVFMGAEYYERELEDMYGIKINGLPNGRRYPLPEDFPKDQYPLRKNWDQKKFEASAKARSYEEAEKNSGDEEKI